MKISKISTLAKVSLIIFAYLIIYYTFYGIGSNPHEGDSINYHIPIAKSYLNGTVLNPALMPQSFHADTFLRYSPGSSEAILALLLLLHIPINLFNVLGIIVLFIISFKLSVRVGIDKSSAIICASSISTLHGILRWVSTQVIDIWLLGFFLLSILLLEKPQKTFSYFLKLGVIIGMVVGSKYFGPFFALVLLAVYGKRLLQYLSFSRVLIFSVPFIIVGLSWYIRNYLLHHDPVYPQAFFIFSSPSSALNGKLGLQVWQVLLMSPVYCIKTLNAYFGEYIVWSLSILLIPLLIVLLHWKKRLQKIDASIRLAITGLLGIMVFLLLPSAPQDNIITSVYRYSYPAFVPLIPSLFLLAHKYNKTELVTVIAVINMFLMPELIYYPKLLVFLLPIGLCIYYMDITSKAKLRKVLHFSLVRLDKLRSKKYIS